MARPPRWPSFSESYRMPSWPRDWGVNRRLIWKWRTERKIPSPPRATVAPAVLSPDQVAQIGKRSDGELAREFGFNDFQIQQVRTRLGIPWHVPDRSEMDARLGTVTDLAIGSTLGIAQLVVSKLRRERGIPATRDALNWTAELQALLPLLSDKALAARAGCGVVKVLSNKTPLREITGLLGTWSDEDLAAQHGWPPADMPAPVSATVSLCAGEYVKRHP